MSEEDNKIIALIRELEDEVNGLQTERDELMASLAGARYEIEDLETRIDKLEADKDASTGDLHYAADSILDCVSRPLGTLHATLPQSSEAERALIRLFDACGRNL